MLVLPSQDRLDCNIGSVFAKRVTTFLDLFCFQFCQSHLQHWRGPYVQQVFLPAGFFWRSPRRSLNSMFTPYSTMIVLRFMPSSCASIYLDLFTEPPNARNSEDIPVDSPTGGYPDVRPPSTSPCECTCICTSHVSSKKQTNILTCIHLSDLNVTFEAK